MSPQYINANFDEAKQTQLTLVEMLVNMGYTYLTTTEVMHQRRDDPGSFILKDIAFDALMKINAYEEDHGNPQRFSDTDVWEAIDRLESVPYEGLIDTSQTLYTMLTSAAGTTIKVLKDGKSNSYNFRYIDFQNPANNTFHITMEYEAQGRERIRPDIVCFVNGIPLVIIECKKSGTSIDEALDQFKRNWGPAYCPQLFSYAQVMIATNGKDTRYGTTGTPPKFFATWKEKDTPEHQIEQTANLYIQQPIDADVYSCLINDLNGATGGHSQLQDRTVTEQDKTIAVLLQPQRLLELVKHHILFDAGIKKISRYQQYFAVRKMLKTIEQIDEVHLGKRRQGGLIWHTQGSGKSLTMVLFVKALIEHPHITNPRIIIVTDRKDLDKQIANTFRACNLKKNITRANTSQQLLDLIKEQSLDVVTTLIHKFERAKDKRADFVDESRDIFVLIDEAHRHQGGFAHLEMKKTIPNACYIGFTGTPLMKKERESWRKFGGYIDKYTIDDALKDEIIVPLIYEGRYVDLTQNQDQVDRAFDRLTKELGEAQKRELQKLVGTKIIKDNPARIAEISYDIEDHFCKKFQGSGLKGQVVAPSKYSAVLFQKLFEERGAIQTAVVISDENGIIAEEDEHRKEVVAYLDSIGANYRNLESYERSVVDSFRDNEDGVELLIVVNKLLTGFDAPRNTVLYLAKDLKDHDLLQAIARVNRLFENDRLPKTAGYIIDYSENAQNIASAMHLFGNFEADDMQGALIDVQEKIQELEQAHDAIHEQFKVLAGSRDDEEYLLTLADEQKRSTFYENLNTFIMVFKECLVLQDFAEEFKQVDRYQLDLKKLLELRKSAALRYADTVDLKEYKQALIKILDRHVNAESVELLTKQISLSDPKAFAEALEDLGSDKSKAEAIAAQTAQTIRENFDNDPEFYDRFSKKLEDIIQSMREAKLADIEALKALRQVSQDVLEKNEEVLPIEHSIKQTGINPKGAGILYRNLAPQLEAHEIAESDRIRIVTGMLEVLHQETIIDWQRNAEVKRIITNKLDDYLYETVKTEWGIDLGAEQMRSLIEQALDLAEKNYELFES
ncbi:MAG: type I restriction endonuclease subunit R [Patescibacteria group bacterium]